MKKGFATSAIIYTLLLLFLVLLIGILSNTQSRKMILDELKNETKQQLEDSNETDICDIELGTSWNFVYQGKVEEWTTPCDGIYKLEVWGASGSSSSAGGTGGYGGYSYGNISLKLNENIYIVAGEAGKYSVSAYNGGGAAGAWFSNRGGGGGGATHIATTDYGELKNYSSHQSDVLIVAGGGGGAGFTGSDGVCHDGGSGGGITGGDGTGLTPAYAGTQLSGGASACGNSTYSGFFGQGAASYASNGAGGGGWYGGGGACGSSASSGGGGSGYLNEKRLIQNSTNTENGVQSGNGKAKITLVSYH